MAYLHSKHITYNNMKSLQVSMTSGAFKVHQFKCRLRNFKYMYMYKNVVLIKEFASIFLWLIGLWLIK